MRLFRSIQLICCAIVCALAPVAALAQDADHAPSLEEQLQWAVEKINEGNMADATGRLTESLEMELGGAGLSGVAAPVLEVVGGFTIESARKLNDHAIRGLLIPALRGSKWIISVRVDEQSPDLIDGISIEPAPGLGAPGVDSWESLDAQLKELGAEVSLGAYRVERLAELVPIHELHAEKPLAVAAAAHGFRLAALAEAVREGRINWDDPVEIQDDLIVVEEHRPGATRSGETATVEQLAGRMMALSDHVAADHIMEIIGRDAVETSVEQIGVDGSLNDPFLTSGEMFRLKLAAIGTHAARYAAANPDERQALIEGELTEVRPNFEILLNWKSPRLIETVGWFASANDMCRMLVSLVSKASSSPDLAPVAHMLTVTTGIRLDKYGWPNVAYIGGAEPGVLSMNWLLIRRDGRIFTLSLNVNNAKEPVNQLYISALAGSAINLMAAE